MLLGSALSPRNQVDNGATASVCGAVVSHLEALLYRVGESLQSLARRSNGEIYLLLALFVSLDPVFGRVTMGKSVATLRCL